MASGPIRRPGRITAPAPIDAPRPTCVGVTAVLVLPASGILVVRERCVRSHEDVVGEPHAVPQLHAGLHGDAIADDDVVLDEDVVAHVAVFANRRPRARARTPRFACARRSSCSRTAPGDARMGRPAAGVAVGHGRSIVAQPVRRPKGFRRVILRREMPDCYNGVSPPVPSLRGAGRAGGRGAGGADASTAEPLGIDQSLWASAVRGLARGQRLYRDVWEQRPPGIYLTTGSASRARLDHGDGRLARHRGVGLGASVYVLARVLGGGAGAVGPLCMRR